MQRVISDHSDLGASRRPLRRSPGEGGGAQREGGPISLLETIGRTPLLRLRRLGSDRHEVEIYAKAEFQNPGGSVKDRAAAAILDRAETSGALRGGRIILDATSGNT